MLAPIRTGADVEAGLRALVALDPRLVPVADRAGPLPLRRMAGGLGGLVAIVVCQQVSRASADAILARLCATIDTHDAHALIEADDDIFRLAGLSRPKQRTVRALAEATRDGRLDMAELEALPTERAVAQLVALPGIGPWTAECYLLFCTGHPDIFPAGDLALRIAVGHAFAYASTDGGAGSSGSLTPSRLGTQHVAAIARSWSPYRSIAARLFWAYYASITRRDALPVSRDPS